MSNYCEEAEKNPIFQSHHDNLHGRPAKDDNQLFEFYCLEIAQAGLSWQTIIKKHHGMKAAFDGFDIATVAAYQQADIDRLMRDDDVIKYRLKIDAIIYNANAILALQKQKGSFANFLHETHCLIGQELQNQIFTSKTTKIFEAKKRWIKIFKAHFKFVGSEIVGEFLMGIAYLPNAHHQDCPIFHEIKQQYQKLPFEDFF